MVAIQINWQELHIFARETVYVRERETESMREKHNLISQFVIGL